MICVVPPPLLQNFLNYSDSELLGRQIDKVGSAYTGGCSQQLLNWKITFHTVTEWKVIDSVSSFSFLNLPVLVEG